MTNPAVTQISQVKDRFTKYVWSEMAVDPIDLIGKTVRIDVTSDGGAAAAYQGRPTRKVTEMVYSGVIREIVEDHGSTVTDQEQTPRDTAEGAVFENWVKTTIFTDRHEIAFTDRAHVVITVLTHP